MPVYLGLFIAIFNYWLLAKDKAKGLILFSVLFVVCPVTIIESTSLYYSYVFLPFLLYWAFRSKRDYLSPKYVTTPLYIFWFWSIIATIISSMTSIGSPNIISIIGTFRYILIVHILSTRKEFAENFLTIIKYILIINAFAVTIELFLLQVWSAESVILLWLKLYGTIGNNASLEHVLEWGEVGRLHGTFSSSAFTGTLSYLGIGIFLMNYFKERNWYSILMILISMYIGFASASKRFFLGAVAVVLLCLFVKTIWRKSLKTDYKIIVLITSVTFAVFILYIFLDEYLSISYYADYLLSGNLKGATESRFGDDGVVNSMIPYIEKYWLTGLGEVTIKDVLVTDSSFYTTLFKTGIIGLLVFLVLLYRLTIRTLASKNPYAAIVLYSILFEYVISTEFFTAIGIVLLSYITTVCNVRKNKCYEY